MMADTIYGAGTTLTMEMLQAAKNQLQREPTDEEIAQRIAWEQTYNQALEVYKQTHTAQEIREMLLFLIWSSAAY